jgi:hypothetical protein
MQALGALLLRLLLYLGWRLPACSAAGGAGQPRARERDLRTEDARDPIDGGDGWGRLPQWIAKQQLARQGQGTKCFWREPVGQQKSAQRHKGTNVPFCGVPAGTEDDRLRQLYTLLLASGYCGVHWLT